MDIRDIYCKIKKGIYLSKLSKMERQLSLSKEFIKTYSILFYASKKGLTKKPVNSFRDRKLANITHKKGVGICSIGRKENLYAKEFVDYYIKLGIKKIIIYDDNEINGEKFEDVLKQYIINILSSEYVNKLKCVILNINFFFYIAIDEIN